MFALVIEILYVILLGGQLITGSFLTIRAINIKQVNLIPLILFFFLNPLEVILILLIGSSNIVNMFANISLVIFTKLTFFRERKSVFWYLLSLLIIIKMIDFVLKLFIPFSLPLNFVVSPPEIPFFYLFLTVSSLSVFLSYPWLGLTALKYYQSIRSYDILPWIKQRYKIIGYSSLIISINSILYFLIPIDTYTWEQLDSFIIGLLLVINTTIFSIANLIAWIMPKRLKRYFNRKYKGSHEKEITENELMEKIREELSKNK